MIPLIHDLKRRLAMHRRNRVVSLAVVTFCVSAAALPSPEEADVPVRIAVPPGHRVLLKALGKGVQIYKSVEAPGGKLAWTLEAPLANLYNDQGEMIGSHYEGPSWETMNGSKILRDGTEPVKSVPSPAPEKDIPWLLVKVKLDEFGAKTLSRVIYIQRLQTSGGKEPPNLPTRTGTKVGVVYTALYVFYEKI